MYVYTIYIYLFLSYTFYIIKLKRNTMFIMSSLNKNSIILIKNTLLYYTEIKETIKHRLLYSVILN